jgi:hypothetical protein
MRTTRILTAAMSGLFLLSACGSGAERAATTTTLAPTTTPPPTTVAATTTTTAPATTTVVATTSVAPTTTTTAAVDQVAAIKQAILDYDTVRTACLAIPTTCDPATYSTGRRAESERAFIMRIAGMNVVLSRRADDPAYYVFESVTIAADSSTATVEVCFWDSDVLATEAGVIFNGVKASSRDTMTVVREQGAWRLEKTFENSISLGQNMCGPRP